MRDIARVLDIRGPSLYAHVASKEDVLWAIVDRVASRFEAAAEATTAEARDAADHLAGRVRPATLADAYADLALRAVEHRPEPVA